MSYNKTNIQVTKIKQLIDLNGDKTNFDLTFNVKSANKESFEAIVVSQSQLDSGIDLDYKKVTNGIISGNIINDKNVYQNYFLLLKSDNPIDCEVEINIKEIEPQKMVETSIDDNYQNTLLKSDNSRENSVFNWKNIFTGIIIIFGIILLYYLYNKSSSSVPTINTNNDYGDIDTIISINDIVPTNEILNIVDSSETIPTLDNNFNENLFNKLNNIKMW